MTRDILDIQKQLQNLPAKERAFLAEQLIASLDVDENEDVEELWLLEAEKRYQEYRKGNIQAKPLEQVFDEAFAAMKS